MILRGKKKKKNYAYRIIEKYSKAKYSLHVNKRFDILKFIKQNIADEEKKNEVCFQI